jgi:integrase
VRLTEKTIRNIELPTDFKDVIVWDDAMPSFGIRFQNNSPRGTFIVQYRLGRKQRRKGLGRVGKVSLDAAKAEAKSYFADVAKLVDPAVSKAKAARKIGVSLGTLIDPFLDYLENDKRRSLTHVDDNRRTLKVRMTKIHAFAPDDVDREMIATELGVVKKDHGPIAMNRSRSHMSKFFNWMIGEGKASANPVTGTNRNEEGFRDRLLDPAEIVKLWNAASSDSQYDKIVRLLILTAMRRTQIGSLRMSEIVRTEDGRNMIELPGQVGRSKNKQKFLLPLSTQALAIIDGLEERKNSEFVFGRGAGGFSGWSNCKERLLPRAGVKDWDLHDFRAAFDTYSQDVLKVPFHIADLLLNHKGAVVRKGTKKHYNFATYYDEKAEAMQKWGDYIEELVSNRVKFRAAA